MIDNILSLIAPHPCSGCGIEGTLLCENCKYDITSELFSGCIACGNLALDTTGLCGRCRVPYQRAWCVGERKDTLYQLLERYKFHRAQEGYRHLAGLLDATLPVLPHTTRIVPVPTISTHIRVRGYDHILLIAREFARIRGLTVDPCIRRIGTTKQLGATRAQRIAQAKQAFRGLAVSDTAPPYLILDDVVTTGSTLKFAAKTLKSQGVEQIWVAAVCRQPMVR